MNNILNNSKDEKITKFNKITEERKDLNYVKGFMIGNRYIYYDIKRLYLRIYLIR